MKIAAVVVTYNRKEILLRNLESLLNQTKPLTTILLIDNKSTDGTEDVLKAKGYLDHDRILYIQLPENIGGAGGFYEGIKLAVGLGYDWIWGMDDDAIPRLDALEQLLRYVPANPAACYCSNADNDTEGYTENIKEIDHLMFVGFFLPRHIVERVGLPRKDFFIYQDDFEYGKRIHRRGFPIYKVKTSIVDHADYAHSQMRTGRLFGKEYSFPVMSSWKIYYLTRNRLLAFSFSEIGKYRAYIGIWRKVGIPLLATNPEQFPMFLKGYFHGILGISGKRIEPSQ